MYERFTDDARRAIQAANQEATRRGHDFICQEHVLLGVLAQEGVVADACRALGAPPATVVQAVNARLDRLGAPSLDQSVARVIGYAIEESTHRFHETIGTEHIMLAILRAGTPEVLQAVEAAGLQADELRSEIVRRCPPGTPTRTPQMDAVAQQFQHHPEVRLLERQLVELQEEKEAAIVRHDFDAAARLRDKKVAVRQELTGVLLRLLGQTGSGERGT